MSQRLPGFDTLAIHSGAQPDPATGARITPIYQTTSYVFNDTDHAASLFGLKAFGNIYTRIMNPTQAVLEERLAALEGGTAALAVASGHAAQLLVFHAMMTPGDNFVAARRLYGGSINQFGHSFKNFGWEVRWADAGDPESFASQIDDKTKAIFIESFANPAGFVTDIEAVSKVARDAGIPLIVDNTMASPYLLRPIEHGADIVVHSLTKFLGGHGNSMGGVIVDGGTFDWSASGQVPDAVRAARRIWRHRAARDLRQLRLRHRLPRARPARPRPGDRADERLPDPHRHRDARPAHAAPLRQRKAVVEAPERPPEGRLGRVFRPQGPSNHELQKRYSPNGAGAVFTFGLKGGHEAGVKFVESLEMVSHLANIGDTRTLVIHPASTTHRQLTDEQRAAAGAGNDVVRLSIGIENADDIIADIDQALAKA
jgi:O-acetylhomoserine (thiol)-lyase